MGCGLQLRCTFDPDYPIKILVLNETFFYEMSQALESTFMVGSLILSRSSKNWSSRASISAVKRILPFKLKHFKNEGNAPGRLKAELSENLTPLLRSLHSPQL